MNVISSGKECDNVIMKLKMVTNYYVNICSTKPYKHYFLQNSSLYSSTSNLMAVCSYTRSALGHIRESTFFLRHPTFVILARG